MTAARSVGVVGFGPAGGALALLLARAGLQVTLFERAPVLGPVGAGLLLQLSGQAVLRQLNLLDTVAKNSEPIEYLHAVLANGRTLVQLRYDTVAPGGHAWGVHRGVLFDALRQAIAATSVVIRTDHEIRDYRQTDAAIFPIDQHGNEHGPFDVLAIADGSRSQLRQRVVPGSRPTEYALGALWGVGPCPAVRRYLHQSVRSTTQLCGVLPTGHGQATLFWGAPTAQFESLRQAGFADFRDAVVKRCPLTEEIFTTFTDFDQAVFATYRHCRPGRCHDGRAVLVGDACHAMSPHLGQGANLALLDAWTLANALLHSNSLPIAWRQYTERRRPQVRFYSRLSWLLTPFFQSGSRILGWGRDIALPLMQRTPIIRRQMERALAGMKTGLFTHQLPDELLR